jgi:Ca-activated chloride channel family protein
MGSRAVFVLFALAVSASASAQEPDPPVIVLPREDPAPPPSGPVFAAGLVEYVHVAVSARDAKGHVVTNLEGDDFEVTEDGRPQKIQLFARAIDGLAVGGDPAAAREALSLDLGLLLDTSESMLKELKLSQEAATRFLEAIPRARELYTIFFDEDIRVSRYDSENQQGLFERIHAAKGGGNTALYDAIAVYLSRVQDGSGRKVLVLFSDGEDTKSGLPYGDLLDLVRSSRVTIYSIAFGVGPGSRAVRPRAVLTQLANMTGGQVFTPANSRDLRSIYDEILADVAAQFVIGYVPDNPARDGKFRKLKVTVKKPGISLRHRSGYIPREAEAAED